MGAFHNQIRENETFESLLELYYQSVRENTRLREALDDAIWAAEFLADQQAMPDDGYVERLDRAFSACAAILATQATGSVKPLSPQMESIVRGMGKPPPQCDCAAKEDDAPTHQENCPMLEDPA